MYPPDRKESVFLLECKRTKNLEYDQEFIYLYIQYDHTQYSYLQNTKINIAHATILTCVANCQTRLRSTLSEKYEISSQKFIFRHGG